MSYPILRTDKADEQLRDIIFYIADDSDSVDIALNYLEKIENAINNLKDFPYSGCVPPLCHLTPTGLQSPDRGTASCILQNQRISADRNHLRCCGWKV